MEKYFTGNALWGDAFSLEEIKAWYNAEAEAYADLYGLDSVKTYGSHRADIFYGYKHLGKNTVFENVLGIGSSWGYEFLPVIDRIKHLTILESSTQTRSETLGKITPKYMQPNIDGTIDLPDACFDLITCFSVLHHIPNVTFVLNELFRVLKPGGYLLLREPVISMGDWRTARPGLTANERGIPKDYLLKIIEDANMTVVKKSCCSFISSFLIRNGFKHSDKKWYLYIDKFLSNLFAFNVHYHAKNKRQRISPMALFCVLKKPQ
ncbi:MAG: class I SAM-dependent methyltransferase [Tannerellaceae bacterium]|jgi:SAM-dependent methyltransferase|nr:class I SAM-dependent methyltransferase [Tannerellaceae bacterium]